MVKNHESNVQENDTQNNFALLPPETKLHIFSFLNAKDLARANKVCREWKVLTKDKHLHLVPDYQHPIETTCIAENIVALAQSDDRRYIAIFNNNSQDNFSLLDTQTNDIVCKMTIDPLLDAWFTKLSLTPDNNHLIATHYKRKTNYIFEREYSFVDIWNLESKKRIVRYEDLNNYKDNNPPRPLVEIVSNDTFIVSFTHYGKAVFGSDVNECGKIYLCNINKYNKRIVDIDIDSQNAETYFRASCLSSDKKLFARIINNDLYIHDAQTGRKIKSISLKDFHIYAHSDMQFLDDDQAICIFDMENGQKQGFQNPRLIKINCYTGDTEIYKLASEKIFDDSLNNFAILPNNHLALMGNDFFTTTREGILIWDIATNKLINNITLPVAKIFSSENGYQMFAFGWDDQLYKVKFAPTPSLKHEQEEENIQAEKLRTR